MFRPSSRSRISPSRAARICSIIIFEEPKYDVEECQQRGMTYAAPLKVTLRLIVFDVDEDTGAKSVNDIKEQDVYMGDIPFMTDERHLRRQRHRARDRLARCTAARACSSITTRARPIPPANICSPPASFPIAVRGSISNSTPRILFMSASTAAANCRRPRCFMRSKRRNREIARQAPRKASRCDRSKCKACRRKKSSRPSMPRSLQARQGRLDDRVRSRNA